MSDTACCIHTFAKDCPRAALAARADTSDPEGLRADDADKLRVLATWFDDFDDWREKTGKIAPGIAEYREVQTDLRRIAAALRVTPPGLDVERLARAMFESEPSMPGVPTLTAAERGWDGLDLTRRIFWTQWASALAASQPGVLPAKVEGGVKR